MFFARNLIVSCVTQFVWICVLRWRSVSGRVSSIIPPVAGGFKRPIALKFDTSPAAAIKQCIIIIIIILFNRTLSPYSHTYRYSITHSLFHSRLKSFLFCKSSLPFSHPGFTIWISQTVYFTSEHIRLLLFTFSVFTLF